MPFQNLDDTLKEHLKDLYNAEKQLVAALPALAKGAEEPSLRQAFEEHLAATKGHVTRLESVFELMGMPARGKTCVGMKGLIDEGKEVLAERNGSNGAAIDAALIAAAQKVEHYEISAYGSAKAFAELLDMSDVAELLQSTLDEENEANDMLTSIAEETVNPAAMQDEEEEEEEEEEEGEEVGATPARSGRPTARTATKSTTRSVSKTVPARSKGKA